MSKIPLLATTYERLAISGHIITHIRIMIEADHHICADGVQQNVVIEVAMILLHTQQSYFWLKLSVIILFMF